MAASAPVAPGSGPCVCPHCCFLPWRGASPARSPGKGPFRVRPSEAAWGSARRGPGLTGTAQSQNRTSGPRGAALWQLAADPRAPPGAGCAGGRQLSLSPPSPCSPVALCPLPKLFRFCAPLPGPAPSSVGLESALWALAPPSGPATGGLSPLSWPGHPGLCRPQCHEAEAPCQSSGSLVLTPLLTLLNARDESLV